MSDALSAAFADEWGRVVATLVRVTGDWALAEDAAQDAFAAATVTWPRDGVPTRPGAWLTTVARNRALDRLRRAGREARLLDGLATDAGEEERDVEPDDVPDDRLRLIFTCCHPALPMEARVALTLRTLCGLTVAEIAAAFGVAEPAMAKRLVRARTRIRVAGIPYRVPSGALLEERLPGVLAVLYLLFTEGYAPSAGPAAARPDLAREAIRLARVLARLLPDDEVLGLLALELLQDSRRAARTDADGGIVPLEEQDRTRWDAAAIEEALAVLALAERGGADAGPYRLQARIAAEHARGPSADGEVVIGAYDALLALTGSPWIELARAVAVGNARGPDAGLAALHPLRVAGALAEDPGPAAAEAELQRRAGRLAQAAAAYREALALVRNDAERRHLQRRLQEVDPPGPTGAH